MDKYASTENSCRFGVRRKNSHQRKIHVDSRGGVKRILILILLGVFAGHNCLQARTVEDTSYVYFHRGYSSLDLSFQENRHTLDSFVERIKGLVSDVSRLNIVLTIEGNTSPDGDIRSNVLLSKNRAHRVLEYIRQRVAIPDSLIHIEADGSTGRDLRNWQPETVLSRDATRR